MYHRFFHSAWCVIAGWSVIDIWFMPVIGSLGHHCYGFSLMCFLQCVLFVSHAGFTFAWHLLKSDLVCLDALFFCCVTLCFCGSSIALQKGSVFWFWSSQFTVEYFTLFERSSTSFALCFKCRPMWAVCGLLLDCFGFAEFLQVSWVHETGIVVSWALLKSAEVW